MSIRIENQRFAITDASRRGGHDRQRKTERCYVVSRRLAIAHGSEALEAAPIIEYCAGTFEPGDDCPSNFTEGAP